MQSVEKKILRATTILAVRRTGELALCGDGQVTIGDVVMKQSARKVRELGNGRVLAGFAGGVADALGLFDRFEAQLEKHSGNTKRAAVELAREWRTDRFLRRLEAQLLVCDLESLLLISGDGEVIEPDGDVLAIGSGGAYAQAAAIALLGNTSLSAREVADKALRIAADLCIYTNHSLTLLTLPKDETKAETAPSEQR